MPQSMHSLEPRGLSLARLRWKRLMHILGTIRPKVIARIIRKAVVPSAIVWTSSSGDALPARALRLTKPPAIRNRNTPGSRDTTEAKAKAANGSRSRSAIGETMVPTTRHATSAPVSTLAPDTEIGAQRAAVARIPITTGIGTIRHGMAKNVLYAATATPAAITSYLSDNGYEGPKIGRLTAPNESPSSRPMQIMRIIRLA